MYEEMENKNLRLYMLTSKRDIDLLMERYKCAADLALSYPGQKIDVNTMEFIY